MATTKISEDEAREYAENIINTVREPLIVLDQNLKVVSASASFYEVFKVNPDETVGQLIYDLGNKQWNIPKLRELLETILPQKRAFDNYEVEHDFANIGRRIMLLNARQIEQAWGKERIILLAIEDITDRKQLEDALTESEERYRRLFETANDGIVLLEKREGKITHANPSIKAMLGYPKEELVGKDLKGVGFPDDVGTVQEILQTLEETGILHYRKARVKKKTGEVVDADIYMVDKANLIQCNVRDIANQQRREEALIEALGKNERKYRLIAEHMADVITTMDMDLRFTYVSPSVMRIRGFTVEEALGQTIDQTMTPDSLQFVSQVYDEELHLEATGTAAPDRSRIMELQEYKKDGSTIWVENTSSFIRDEDQKSIGILVVSRDITERKQAEESLRSSNEKFHSMVDNIGIGVALISPAMEVLEMNRQMQAWFPDTDLSVRPICYQTFVNPSRDALCDNCPTHRTLQDGNVYEGTNVMSTPEGPRTYRIISSPIFNELGSVTATIEMVEDITERMSLENQLRQAQKMESVGRLAGGVAHDYNNALSVIIGFTEMAIGGVEPDGPVHDDLEEVLLAAKRATDITRQLLAFARKQAIAPKVLDLNESVGSMLTMLRRLIGEDINLAWLPGASLWPVKMDPTQIDQILANLCVNARDAIENVGKISIETSKVAIDNPYCADHAGFIPGEFVVLAVSDSGCGMDKEIMGNIFEPFFTTKDIDKGTGLGLATVYGIVKQNNGFINVYSEPGEGTTFKIYLPRHEGEAVDVQDESSAEFPQGQGETILLVEDDLSILKLASKILKGLGYTVLTSEKPDKIMDLAEEHSGMIHLLITDVIMPEMNGRELSQQLQSLYPDIKCVFMSGYTADIIAHHGVLEEEVQFIPKPFSKRDLAITVRKALDE